MGTKYDLLKSATIAGTLFALYQAFTNSLLLEDLLIVLLVAVTLAVVARERDEKKTRQERVQTELPEVIARRIDETIRKGLTAG